MKKLLSLAVLISASAFASDALIVKTSGSYFAPQEYVHSETCEVFSDKVIITKIQGTRGATAIKLVEERKVNFEGDLGKVIDVAATEKVELGTEGPCDAPGTSTYAKTRGGELSLFLTGNCGQKTQERFGLASNKLKAIVDLYCPLTYGKRGHSR